MPPILAPLTNNITLAISTFIVILFAYHLILKIFSLREAANNIKLLSEAAKNCDSDSIKQDEIKLKIASEIEFILEKTKASLDFESHYKELFGHISKLVIYIFFACTLVLMGAMVGIWLTLDRASGVMTPHEITIIKWVFLGCSVLLAFMLWSLRDLPESKPIFIWIAFSFVIGLVFGASAIKSTTKATTLTQSSQCSTDQATKPLH
nr:hypothetical protein [uncultured Holophaga sp.]